MLWACCEQHPDITLQCPDTIQSAVSSRSKTNNTVTLTLNSGEILTADLLIGADGGRSWVRQQFNFPLLERAYQHDAIVAVIACEKPHWGCALQPFLPTGPLGVLPLANPHQVAIVWSADLARAEALVQLPEVDFNRELTNALQSRLGSMKLLSARQKIPLIMRHAKQYVMENVALVGDAAHTIHPLAGQGVNLGFQDALALTDEIIQAAAKKQPVGGLKSLRRYERRRKTDNTVMLMIMRLFKEVFAEDSIPIVTLRSQGLTQVNKLNWLKRCLMAE